MLNDLVTPEVLQRLELQKCEPLARKPHAQGRPLLVLSNLLTCTAQSLRCRESSDLASSDSPRAWLSSLRKASESCESLAATYILDKARLHVKKASTWINGHEWRQWLKKNSLNFCDLPLFGDLLLPCINPPWAAFLITHNCVTALCIWMQDLVRSL